MAKKNKRESTEPQLDMSKGFGSSAFASLKSLQDKRRAEESEQQAEARRQEEARMRREAEARKQAAGSRSRYTAEDVFDDSNMTDAEIFAASMAQFETGDIYQSKFNTKEPPVAKKAPEEKHLSMTDEEREFAIFTQEMAMSNVQRLAEPAKPVHKTRNKKKYQNAEIEAIQPVSVDAKPSEPTPGMQTTHVDPVVTVTQIEKGDDIIEHPDVVNAITASQKKLLKDAHHYEGRYGMVMTLHLRGLTLNAAMSRLESFVAACMNERKPYAQIVCGKGLNSPDRPVIKETVIDWCRQDSRVTEYAPVLNEDGDFGSLFISLKLRN